MSDPTDPTQVNPPPPPGASPPPPPPGAGSTPPPPPGGVTPPPGTGSGGGGTDNTKGLMIGGGILVLILLIIGGFVLFSGDDDGDSELSQADFVAAYSEICVRVDGDIAALDAESFEEATVASAEAQRLVEQGVSELRALEPPADIADEVEQGTDLLAQTGDVFGELAEEDDEDAFIAATGQVDELRGQAKDALTPLGIDCDAEGDGGDGDSSGDVDPGGSSGDDGGAADGLPAATAASDASDYGDDPALDALADSCEAGDVAACDDLFLRTPSGSDLEDYGDTCGGRNEPAGFCTTIYPDAAAE